MMSAGKWTRHVFHGGSHSCRIGMLHDDSGGMAQIYEANLLESSTIKYLCKVSREEEASRTNLQNEIRILEKIHRKKGVETRSVKMVDFGTRESDHFIILEHLKGIDLHDHLKSRKAPFGFDEFVLLATDLLLTIEHIHALKVIHRDIKPKNIRYSPRAQVYNRTRCLDFGISLELGESLIDTPNNRHLKCKSQGYSPPEAGDENIASDYCFDIYSVGAIMYYCATLTNPSEFPTDEGHHPRIILPSFNKSLNSWIAKSTHPIPRKRFRTAREAINALHAISKPTSEPWVTDYATSSAANRSKYSVSELTKSNHPLDLVIVMDSTDSMEPYRKQIEKEVNILSELMFQVNTDLRMTIIGLGDYESSETLQIASANNHSSLSKALSKFSSVSGGGDDAEAYEFAFSVLARHHKWRSGAKHMVLVIGDSFSHGFPNRLPFFRGARGDERTKIVAGFCKQFENHCKLHGLSYDSEWPRFKEHKFSASDNYGSRGETTIKTTNPLLQKLHKDYKTNRVMRPNIDRALEILNDNHSVQIHTLHCGNSELSRKFLTYVSVRGNGVMLGLDSEDDVVAALCALILSTDKSNYEMFVSQLSDEQTSLLQPATTMVATTRL